MAKSMYEHGTLVKSWKTSLTWLHRKPGGNIEIFQTETENHSCLTPLTPANQTASFETSRLAFSVCKLPVFPE